jgi:hypothetical protein
LLLATLGPAFASSAAPTTRPRPTSYPVDKHVSDFGSEDDFSTPEAAYATIIRRWAEGFLDWRDVSTVEARKSNMAGYIDREPVGDEPQRAVAAKIIEVWAAEDRAIVHAEAPDQKVYVRTLGKENGRWLNAGAKTVSDLDDARQETALMISASIPRPKREAPADPDTLLARCIEHINSAGQPAEKAILESLSKHRLTVIGEMPNRPTYWGIATGVVQDPSFVQRVGTIYLELPTNDQPLVEQFLAADKYDREPVLRILRDMPNTGMPDASMLAFFEAVWRANHAPNTSMSQRVRIILVDVARQWDTMRVSGDMQKMDGDRSRLIADNVLRHLTRRRRDNRNALLIVGFEQAEHITCSADGATSIRTAGSKLREALGDQLYTFLEHGPVITAPDRRNPEMPQAPYERRALGLFDAALKSADRAPVAFPLAGSPFADQLYDADADPMRRDRTASTYGEAFDAYLYAGPYETESLSPIIDSFYTDGYVKELDRRYKLMNNDGLLAANIGAADLTGAAVQAAIAKTWGQPRGWNYGLVPLTAWRDGDEWKARAMQRATKLALSEPNKMKKRAQEIFEKLRDARPDKPEKLAALGLGYKPYEEPDAWVEWVTTHLVETPIKTIEIGDLSADALDRPSVPYRVTLSDNSTLEGDLPFVYEPLIDQWEPVEGLDWHLGLDAHARPSTLNPFGQ